MTKGSQQNCFDVRKKFPKACIIISLYREGVSYENLGNTLCQGLECKHV